MGVGVRELKARLSAYLSRVKSGEVITVTERGRAVARLVPVEPADRTGMTPHIAALIASGQATWSGRRLRPLTPLPVAPGDKTIAEYVSEDRR